MLIGIVLFSISPVLCTNAFIFPCYYQYQPWILTPQQIPTHLCTHIIVASCISETPVSAELHNRPMNCTRGLKNVLGLRKKNANLKFLITMGTNATAMHLIVNNSTSMNMFINSVIAVILEYDYDGVDFDWEYPCNGTDRFLYTEMFRILRERLQTSKLITAAISSTISKLNQCYDLDGLSKYLDFINVMCYNYNSYHFRYNKRTAYSSPLFARPEEKGDDALKNTNSSIMYLLAKNVPKEKLVVGLALDGHTYQLSNANQTGFYANVSGVGYGGGWTKLPELCQLIRNGGKAVYDDVAKVFYGFFDDQWLNTNDVRSAVDKAVWVKKLGLAGLFTWSLNLDDIYNLCGYNVTFPLHRAIHDVLFNDHVNNSYLNDEADNSNQVNLKSSTSTVKTTKRGFFNKLKNFFNLG